MKSQPLILTLKLEDSAQLRFNELRKTHFPKHCNYMDAHLTLFHHLPSGLNSVSQAVTSFASRPAMNVEVAAVKNIGSGVAYAISSAELQNMHKQMQKNFDRLLISQDRQKLWPHITVQNKVTAYKALLTFKELEKNFHPFQIKATGISTWLYLGAAWEWVKDDLFQVQG